MDLWVWDSKVDCAFSTADNWDVLRSSVEASDRKCRLLYLVGKLGRGGAERQLCYLLQAIDRERYRPAVVVWNHSPDDVLTHEIAALGIPMHLFPHGVSRSTKLRQVRQLARQLEPEVIHSYFFYTNFGA